MGYGVALVIHFASPSSAVGAALLNMAVFGAVIAYVMQMISYLRLRRRFPAMKRPYISPAGRLWGHDRHGAIPDYLGRPFSQR